MHSDSSTNALNRIGLFDSGVGGLSILRYLQEKSSSIKKDLKFVYLGDTGRCPYGDRSATEISLFVEQIVNWFNSAGVDRIVMACNTSAAVAAPIARQLSEVPVHDLISSAAKFAATNFKRVGVIATTTTCRTKAFSRAISEHNANVQVCEIACPDLVPMVERGVLSGAEVDATIAKYTKQLQEFEIDSLIFGCTHFPFLESAFRTQLSDSVSFIDPALHLGLEILGSEAEFTHKQLDEAEFQKNTYFCTGDQDKFGRAAELCLGLKPQSLKDSICTLDLKEMKRATCRPNAGKRTVILKSPFYNSIAGRASSLS